MNSPKAPMLSETRTRPLPDPAQEKVEEYCHEAKTQLDAAPDREAALKIRDLLCARFSEQCTSTLVLAAAQSYVDRLIAERWGRS